MSKLVSFLFQFFAHASPFNATIFALGSVFEFETYQDRLFEHVILTG